MSEPADIAAAASILRNGGLVAFPTETVYGLGADASNPAAVARIYAAKGRPASHPVIVHIASAAEVPRWAREFPEAARRLAAAFWPGPLTLVLPRAEGVADAVTGGQDTVALRVPGHPIALALLAAFGGGIAAPSANRYGKVSPTRAAHVRSEFGATIDCVLEGGDCAVGLESTIVSLVDGEPRLLRPGGIPRERIEAVIGPMAGSGADAPRVPGSVKSHYAPAAALELLEAGTLDARVRGLRAEDRIAVLSRRDAPAGFGGRWFRMPADPAGYGHELYAALRELDAGGAARILVEQVPPGPGWEAVEDRLARAAARESPESP
ncbi:MAG: L-threonylcarbamoyladenylate synthase [Steroidobacteraceae bacterium]|jgi:L-threonylcarbamoyladenylate synthase|nr:L-threonylcarbamoyladenylate synthase [Steroidobacteraceae bacterium]